MRTPRTNYPTAGRVATRAIVGHPRPAPVTHWLLHLGAGLYASNLAVGVTAQVRGTHFGQLHHWLYAAVFGAAIAVALFAWHPALLLTLTALAALPTTKPRTIWHPTIAIVGALGYLACYLF
jgi:hypothetical protein